MIGDPGRAPVHGLAPAPVRVEVIGHDIDRGQFRDGQLVQAGGTAALVLGAARDDEEALRAGADKMLPVKGLDVGRHLCRPAGERGSRACGRSRIGSAADAARLVGQLPGHDRRVVLVGHARDRVDMVEQVRDPGLVPGLDRGVGIEVIVERAAGPCHVLVHSAEIGPVAGERDHQLQADLACLSDDVIEVGQPGGAVVVGHRGAVEGLEYEPVLGRLIQPAPRPQYVEAVRGRGVQDVVDHERGAVHEVVVVRADEVERPAVEGQV